MVHLDLHDKTSPGRIPHEPGLEAAPRRSSRHRIRKRLLAGRQVQPVGIAHPAAVTPVRQRLATAVAARHAPRLGGDPPRDINRGKIRSFRALDPDGHLRRVAALQPQKEREVVQPLRSGLDHHLQGAVTIRHPTVGRPSPAGGRPAAAPDQTQYGKNRQTEQHPAPRRPSFHLRIHLSFLFLSFVTSR